MECVNVAKAAMGKSWDYTLFVIPFAVAQMDQISFMGIPTPNIFTGVETYMAVMNLHVSMI